MHLVIGNDVPVAEWASAKLGFSIYPPFVAMGIADDDERLHGAIVFNNYNGANIEVTVFAPGLFHRRFICAVMSYAFEQVGALRLTARTRRGNRKMKEIMARLGFEYEGTMRNYYGPAKNDAAHIYRLDPAKAKKWMVKDGRTHASPGS